MTQRTTQPIAEENDLQKKLIDRLQTFFAGRHEPLDALMRHVLGSDTRPLLLLGPEGAGKSATLAQLLRILGQQHPQVVVVAHFLEAGPHSGDLPLLLQRLTQELQRALGLPVEAPPGLVRAQVSLFQDLLGRLPDERRVVLVVDGLGQQQTARAEGPGLAWLPHHLPAHVKMILSCRDDPDQPHPLLLALRQRTLPQIDLAPLTDEERRSIASQAPLPAARMLTASQMDRLLANPGTANPLYLLTALAELGANADAQIDSYRQAAISTELFQLIFQLYRQHYAGEVVETVLAALAFHREGLPESSLEYLTKDLPGRDDLLPLLHQLRPHLIDRRGLLGFAAFSAVEAARQLFPARLEQIGRELIEQELLIRQLQEERLFQELGSQGAVPLSETVDLIPLPPPPPPPLVVAAAPPAPGAAAPAPAVPREQPPMDENVQFTVYRPKVVVPDKWYPLLVFAHLSEKRADAPESEPDPIQEVKRQAEAVLGERQTRQFQPVTQDSSQPVPRDGQLIFVPEMDGVEFNPPRRCCLWEESVQREEFRLRARRELHGQTVRGRLSVFLDDILLADVALAIRVDANHQPPREHKEASESASARPYRKIFASYSHKDAHIVEQVERLARLYGDEFLRDFKKLRSGEAWSERLLQMIAEADVFQLFWSRHAMESPEVRKEYEYALSLGRPHFVRPTYWEEPLPRAPERGLPPEALLRLHFQKLGPVLPLTATEAPREVDIVPQLVPPDRSRHSTLGREAEEDADYGDDGLELDLALDEEDSPKLMGRRHNLGCWLVGVLLGLLALVLSLGQRWFWR